MKEVYYFKFTNFKINMIAIIKTRCLILRQWQDSDTAPFIQMCADDEVMRYFPAPLIPEQSLQFIEKTYPTYWDKGFLNNEFPKAEIFNGINIKLPGSYPIYRLDSNVLVQASIFSIFL